MPIRSSLGLVICRHPLDALLSHLEYSFKDGNTSYSNTLFSGEKEKIEFTVQNHFPENFMSEHNEFTAWSMMDNFLTVSYEDAVNTLTKNRATGSMRALAKLLDIDDFEEFTVTLPLLIRDKLGGFNLFQKNYPKIFENKFFNQYCEFYGYSNQSVSPPTRLEELNADARQFDDDRPAKQILLVQEDFGDTGYSILRVLCMHAYEDKDFVEEMQKKEIFYVLLRVWKKLKLNKCRRIISEKTSCFVKVSHCNKGL